MRIVTVARRADWLAVAALLGLLASCGKDGSGSPMNGPHDADGDPITGDDGGTSGSDADEDAGPGDDAGMLGGDDAGTGPGGAGKCAPWPALADGAVCQIEGSGDQLLIRATLLAPDGVLEGGELLVSARGSIECIGCDCMPDKASVRTLTCPDAVVSPGLINAHDHLGWTHREPALIKESYDHRHDWRLGERSHRSVSSGRSGTTENMMWGELRQLMLGTTAVAGSTSGKGLLRNLDRASESGLPGQTEVVYQTFPLGDSGGALLTDSCDYRGMKTASKYAGGCRLLHVAEGIDRESRNEFLCLSSADDGGVDVTGMGAAFVHAIGLLPGDGQRLADTHTAVVWSPRSNVALYGNTAPVTMFREQGVLLALGTDWTPSGSTTIVRELACAEQLNRNHFDAKFSEEELWRMVTSNAAKALEVDDVVGSLAPGLVADLAIYRRSKGSAYRAVFDATAGTTLLVLKGGAPIYGDEAILSGMRGITRDCEVMPDPVCGTSKAVCLSGSTEGAYDFAALAAKNAGSYALVFCETPADEPSCTPSRASEYTGTKTDLDLDGDGIANDADNCPRVFNPARPVDRAGPSDVDGDGLGDVCDPCPLEPGVETCRMSLADDRDGDGKADADDNCPVDYNSDQLDTDRDGRGDLCDACPANPNPAGQACAATIYQVKRTEGPAAGIGRTVRVRGVVTAGAATGFFMQVPEPERPAQDGVANSGVFVYLGATPKTGLRAPSAGDATAVTAQVTSFYGQIQLSNVSAIELVAAGQPVPAPLGVTPADVATGGPLAAALEGMLVRVKDVAVTALEPTLGAGDTKPNNEFVVSDSLRVDDFMFLVAPFPELGEPFLSITGVLRFANRDSKLEPRDAFDLERGLALRGVTQSETLLTRGDSHASGKPPVHVVLNQPAPPGGVVIALESSAPEAVVVASSVTIPEGESQAEILFSVPGMPAGGTATVTATWGAAHFSVSATVVGEGWQPALVSLDPELSSDCSALGL